MKTIIAGSRTISDISEIESAVADSGFDITEVVCGCADGVDVAGREWGRKYGIPVKDFPAEWEKYGKSAGIDRNIQMARYAEALIAVWDGQSRGTGHMLRVARMQGLQVFVRIVQVAV